MSYLPNQSQRRKLIFVVTQVVSPTYLLCKLFLVPSHDKWELHELGSLENALGNLHHLQNHLNMNKICFLFQTAELLGCTVFKFFFFHEPIFTGLLVSHAVQIPQFTPPGDGFQFLPLYASLRCTVEDTERQVMGIAQENKFKSRWVQLNFIKVLQIFLQVGAWGFTCSNEVHTANCYINAQH